MLYQQVSERAVIDVSTSDNARCRKRVLVAAAVHDQRRPFGDLGPVLGVFHSVVAVACGHRLEALAQKGDIVLPPDKAHVRAGMDEATPGRHSALADPLGPQPPPY